MTPTGPESIAALSRRQDKADLERQQARSDLATHEQICGERYKALEASNAEIKSELATVNTTLKTISDAQIATAAVRQALAGDRPKWWHPVALGTAGLVATCLIGIIGWMGATIWNMQNARVDAALQRSVPTATVTVNPRPEAAPSEAPSPLAYPSTAP